MIVIGTSGHIDHGKSSIIKRLTGTDPDRLPEEQERGMTIDLGFAFLTTPQGEIGFVDVPGHERFVRNMISGATGMDSVMLVVAADDGWMPQSEEHFHIVRLLGARHGFIVINKCDLATDEWLELLESDIRKRVSGSVFQDARIFRISAATGNGFDQLHSYLVELAGSLPSKQDIGKPRLPIDRSFVQSGIGGVVTGTLRGGAVSVGQAVTVWPSLATGKIRSLQSHNEQVTKAFPGQRTAIGFTGIERESLVRGGTVTIAHDLGHFVDHPILAIAIELLKNSPVDLEDRRRVSLLVGTTEVEGEIRLFRDRPVASGNAGVVFFKSNTPVYTHIGDHTILRLPTPAVTLGGGVIIDHLSHVPRKRDWDVFDYLTRRVPFTIASLVLTELEKTIAAESSRFLQWSDFSSADIARTIDTLINEKTVITHGDSIFSAKCIAGLWPTWSDAITRELSSASHLKGFPVEHLSRLWHLETAVTEKVCAMLVATQRLVKENDVYAIAGRTAELTGPVKLAFEAIMKDLKANPFTPPTLEVLASGGRSYRDAIRFIVDNKLAHKCGSDFLIEIGAWQQIERFAVTHLSKAPSLSVNDMKQRFSLTRKHAIPILEETDRMQLTRRDRDVRIKGAHYDAYRIS